MSLMLPVFQMTMRVSYNDSVQYRRVGSVQATRVRMCTDSWQLQRAFHSVSILGLTCVIMATWEAIFSTGTFSLVRFLGQIYPLCCNYANLFAVCLTSHLRTRALEKSRTGLFATTPCTLGFARDPILYCLTNGETDLNFVGPTTAVR